MAPLSAALIGLTVWAVARIGLETADQTASVVGGIVGLIGMLVSLRTPRTDTGPGTSTTGVDAGREWLAAAARSSSYRPPLPQAPVRGRNQELAALHRLAARDGYGYRLAVLCGAGGLGKTTLAAEAARQADQAGLAVFWVRWQDDRTRLADDLTRIARILGLPDTRLAEAQHGDAVLVDTVWEHLAATADWMIVVDNVDTPARVGTDSDPVAAYRGWLRPGGRGLLMITTRDTSPSTWGRQADIVHLQPLDDTAAGAVLHDAAPGAGTADDALALGARLGGLPLALDAAGRYLASPTSQYRTFTAYHQALEREFGDLIGAAHPRAADPAIARAVVRHTWDLSLDQLHADGCTQARSLLYLLALLEAAPIPRSLITTRLLADATGRPVTTTALEFALAGLHRYGLLATPLMSAGADDRPTHVGQVVLHPLLREVIALTSPSTDPAPWLAAITARLAQAVGETVQAGRAGWITARLLAPHLPPTLRRTAETDFTASRNTLDQLAAVLREAGAATEEHLLRRCIADAEIHHLGPDHPDALTSRNNLADVLSDLGRHQEAADLHREVLTAGERALGPHHPITLISRNNLASTFGDLGRYREAADLHLEELAASERVLGTDHPHTLNSRGNLANALHRLGQYQQAADLHRRTLTDRERILGPDHPHTLSSRNNLSTALGSLGQHQQAASLCQRTLTDRERILGPDHPDTLASRGNLANALVLLGQYQQAADLHRRTLTDRERVLGPDHPDTLNSRNNLAIALGNLGQHQQAASLCQRTLTDYERILGPDHPHTLNSRGNLANALHHLGQHQQAADLHRRTLTDRERILGPDHPHTLISRVNLAETQAAFAAHTRRRTRWRFRRQPGGGPGVRM